MMNVFIFLLFLSVNAQAKLMIMNVSSLEQETDTTPTMELIEGQPIRARWEDGRVAILHSRYVKDKTYNIEINNTKNSCNQTPAFKCNYQMAYAIKEILFLWEKHPDESKVGQFVIKKYHAVDQDKESINVFYRTFDFSEFNKVSWSKMGFIVEPGFLKDRFTCDHYEWLPLTEDESLTIPYWKSEFNFEIAEALGQATANQTNQVARDVRFQKNNEAYELVSIRSYSEQLFDMLTPILGTTIQFVFPVSAFESHPFQIKKESLEQTPFCNIEMSINIQQLADLLLNQDQNEYEIIKKIDLSTTEPVVFSESDPFYFFNPYDHRIYESVR